MDHFLLLGAIKGSQKEQEANAFLAQCQGLLDYVNKIYGDSILSAVTWMKEEGFQGVVSSAAAGIDVILAMEEFILEEEYGFKLNYVLTQGRIETDLEKENAQGLSGPGLTKARNQLREMKKEVGRFDFNWNSSEEISKMMRVTQHFIDRWYPKDKRTVSGFLQGHDYKAVAKIEKKDESTLWRRRKSLAIDEYLLCKDLLQRLAYGH